MPIQDSDLLLIEDTRGDSFKITASKFKDNLAANAFNNYKLLVNKPDYSSRFVYAQNMQGSVAPTDYMLVERAGVSYKVTGQQIIDFFPSVPADSAGPIVDVEDINVDGSWQLGNTSGETQWQSVAYGNGKFVAVGSSGPSNTMNSPDGITWTNVEPPSAVGWRSVTFGGSKFVAVAYNSRDVMYSSNGGETWSHADSTSSEQWTSITFGNGRFVCVARSGTQRAQYSPNGFTWTRATSGVPSDTWTSVVYGKDKFVAVGQSGNKRAMWSTDGAVWKDVTTPNASSNYWENVTYGNDLFVAVGGGTSQNIMTSPDGVTWSPVAFSDTLSRVTFGDGVFTAINVQNSYTSTDGITWVKNDNAGALPWKGITYGDGLFVAVADGDAGTGKRSMYSPTGGGISNTSTLTLASDTNLDLFTVGDAIRMVDSDGDAASYTPVTSTITNVGVENAWNQSEVWSNNAGLISPGLVGYAKAFDGNTRSSASLSNQSSTGYTFTIPNELKPVTSFGAYTAQINNMILTGDTIFNFSANSSNDVLNEINPRNIPNNLSTVQFTGTNTNIYLNALIVNNKMLVDAGISGDPGAGNLLTFASPNQDLKFFKPGDVVQGINFPPQSWSTNPGTDWIGYGGGTSYDAAKAFDGRINTSAQSQQPTATLAFSNMPAGTIGVVLPGNVVDRNDLYFEINGTKLTSSNTTASSFDGGRKLNEFNTEVSLSSIVQKSTNSGSSLALYGITFNGALLIDNEEVDIGGVKVISTDIAANTMTVDGGAWEGSDGTSSGDAADRETEVTGSPMSGTGNFAGNTGAVVDVSNSNQEWVPNDNRLGEEFFIKAASTRTGLAVLRTKAIEVAQAWATKIAYEEQSFVIHRGHYWISKSETPSSRPSGKSEEWIDLGPIEAA